MRISFPYPDTPDLAIPDQNLLGVYGPAKTGGTEPADAIIERSLLHPIGRPPLRDVARGKSRVMIVCDDVARPTPAWQVIPSVLRELDAGGVAEENVEFMMALGTHRPMTPEEMRQKVGADVFERFPVYNHEWDNPGLLTCMGKTPQGVEVWVNRKVVEADCVIGIGRIMPIDMCGFTGGGKILIPGCCGETTLDDMHWIRVDVADEDVIGQRDNPVRAAIDAMARQAGLDFIVNIIMNSEKNVLDCVSGHLESAHREGCRRARPYHEVRIPETPDIVVVDGFPFDIEFWQVNKAVDTAGLVVRDGGVVICVSPCYEGLSRTHADVVLRYGYRPREEIKQLVARGMIRPKVVGVHMIQVAHVAIEKATVILVTDGIREEDVSRLGLEYAPSPQEALTQAFARVGTDARVAVLRGASETLPVVG
ncbi:MAG TPA: nickel-dependent lactate racemase [Candidatus Hydrogenedentes bacterium]|nr:nickel-dependent lactate racemase [Candidatus Hydrogenedentota bacterium]